MAHVGTGTSAAGLIEVAVEAALTTALAKVGKEPIAFALVFAGPERSLDTAMRVLEARLPKVPMMGCSTAGEITEHGITKQAIAVVLVAGADIHARGHGVPYTAHDVDQAGTLLSADFAEVARNESLSGRKHSTTFTLVDGISGLGERVVESLRRATRSFQPIIGGAAGDNAKFASTPVAFGTRVMSQGAAVLHVFSEHAIGVGLGTGLIPDSPRMTITKATGNVVQEIDNKPAFEIYQAYAKKRGVKLDAPEAGRFLLEHELGVYFFDELRLARAPLRVAPDGSLTCAAAVPQGAVVCILDGNEASLVDAARRAAEEAKANLKGRPCAGVLIFNCICRGELLGVNHVRELKAVREVLGDVPIAGFLTYGEIARYAGKREGWHNTSIVIAAIPG